MGLKPYTKTVILGGGQLFTIFDPDYCLISKSLLKYGEWQRFELDFLASLLDNGDIVLDCGAYIGTHTLTFSEAVGAEGKVFAFEGSPDVYNVLKTNTAGLSNVEVVNRVLHSDTDSEFFLETSATNKGDQPQVY